MKIPSGFVRPIRFYFVVFLTLSILGLVVINLKLYVEGEQIREAVVQKNQEQAALEMQRVLKVSLNGLRSKVEKIAQWDEVFQQLKDPSYYFFWHDERMQESRYFHSSFSNLEIYNVEKTLLMPTSPSQGDSSLLPQKLDDTLKSILVFKEYNPPHLNIYEPIYQRGSRTIIGYIGVSIDIVDYLLKENTFYHIEKSSIQIDGSGSIPIDEIHQLIQFKPVENPVSEELWTLIKSFMMDMFVFLSITSILVYVIFNLAFYSPIKSLSAYIARLQKRKGAVKPPNGRFLLAEFEQLKQSIYQYHQNLNQAHAKLNEQNQIVWEQARRDVLTNIYNRRAFDEAWNDVLYQYAQEPISTTFILFDCDFFKALNDTYGHEIGDEVIRLTAKTIQDHLPLESPAYRIGGDEFAVIIQNKSLQDIQQIAQVCLTALANASFAQLGVKEVVTFSVGISQATPEGSNDIASLPRQADIAMYKAKQSLQSKIQVYHHLLDQDAQSLVSNRVVTTVMKAVETGESIAMHYQPIVNLQTSEVYYESLVRLNDDNGEMVFPNDIFTVVNRRRLETDFDQQIIKKVVADLKSGLIPKNTGVSVNVSAKTLLQPSFVSLFDSMQAFLNDYKLVIEVTENSLVDHMDYAKDVLNELREKGFKIALDDFGSGYSSIRYLAHMPVDIIKFDRSLVLALCEGDSKTRKIIRSTAAMIREASYQLVMEGIEDKAMQAASTEAGATHIQGFLLGKPTRQPKCVSL